VGRVNGGTVAARTARAAHDPAGVAASGAPTLTVVTRPVLAKVIANIAVPCVAVAHATTALRTLLIAAITSLREGESWPPALLELDAGCAALPPPPL